MKIYKSIYALLFLGQLWASLPQERTITIFIHGTKLTPTVVYKNFFYRKLGLQPVLSYDTKHHKRAIADLLTQTAPSAYCLEDFYIFGWDGRLCFKQRKKAAEELYQALKELIASYQEQHQHTPKIRIITHSHGGNVVLNLAKVCGDNPIIIDELILLACPVQDKTKHLVKADCFKKVYAFYAAYDMFQVIDPQGLYKKAKTKKIFSERTFDHHDKLHQALIKINSRSLMHIDFLLFHFMKHLPELCKQIDLFYKTIIPSQIAYKKVIDIKTQTPHVFFNKIILNT